MTYRSGDTHDNNVSGTNRSAHHEVLQAPSARTENRSNDAIFRIAPRWFDRPFIGVVHVNTNHSRLGDERTVMRKSHIRTESTTRDEREAHLHVKMPVWMRDELEEAARADPTMRTSSNVIRTLVVQYLRALKRV